MTLTKHNSRILSRFGSLCPVRCTPERSVRMAWTARSDPEVKFVKAPSEEQGANLPPSAGLQFFGLVDIDGNTQQMTVRLMDRADTELWSVTLDPQTKAI